MYKFTHHIVAKCRIMLFYGKKFKKAIAKLLISLYNYNIVSLSLKIHRICFIHISIFYNYKI